MENASEIVVAVRDLRLDLRALGVQVCKLHEAHQIDIDRLYVRLEALEARGFWARLKAVFA